MSQHGRTGSPLPPVRFADIAEGGKRVDDLLSIVWNAKNQQKTCGLPQVLLAF